MSEPIDLDAVGPFIIATSYRSGDRAWWGSHEGVSNARGNARRYLDQVEALEPARYLRQIDAINDFTIEAVHRPPSTAPQ